MIWGNLFTIISFVFTILSLTEGRHFERCELVEEFRRQKIPEVHINDFEGESQFNSSAIGTLNWDTSKDLGLFQISDKYWCDWGSPKLTGCRLKCEDLLDDDISDDVKCINEIFEEHKRLSGNGFNAWVAWKVKCEGQNLHHFTSDCQKSEVNSITDYKFTPGIVAPRYSKRKGGFLGKFKKPLGKITY